MGLLDLLVLVGLFELIEDFSLRETYYSSVFRCLASAHDFLLNTIDIGAVLISG